MSKKNSVRIISGKWRQKPIEFIDVMGLRPTPSRIRETLFNWLAFDLVNATVLDLFAGSGILSFEAISRGAKFATLLELNAQVYQQLKLQKTQLLADNVSIIHQDAYQYLNQPTDMSFDYIFLDPPFGQYNLQDLLKIIVNKKLLKDNGRIYLESNKTLANIDLPKGIKFFKQKQAGSVYYGLLIPITNHADCYLSGIF